MDNTKNQKHRTNDSNIAQRSSLINKASNDLECSNEFRQKDNNLEFDREFNREKNNNLEFNREFNREKNNNLEFNREFNREKNNNLECGKEFNRNNLEIGKDYITTNNPYATRDRYATSSVNNTGKTNVEFAKEGSTKSVTDKNHKGTKKK